MSTPDPFDGKPKPGLLQSWASYFRGETPAAPSAPAPQRGIDDMSAINIGHDVYRPKPGATGEWQHQSAEQIRAAGLNPDDFKSKTGAADYGYYRNGEQSVLAAPGTVPSSLSDWTANMRQAFGMKSAQHAEFVELAKKVQAHDGDNLTALVGHSKGGAAATLAGEVTGVPVVTANAARLHVDAPQTHGYSAHPNHDPSKDRHFVVAGEPLQQVQGGFLSRTLLNLRQPPDASTLHAPAQQPVDHPSMRQHVPGLDMDQDMARNFMRAGDAASHSLKLHGAGTVAAQLAEQVKTDYAKAARDAGLTQVDRMVEHNGKSFLVEGSGPAQRYAEVSGRLPGGGFNESMVKQLNEHMRQAPKPDAPAQAGQAQTNQTQTNPAQTPPHRNHGV